MPGLLHRLCLIPLAFALTTPVLAQVPPRGFTCTNIMGGNPFRLTIFEDGIYVTAPHPGSSLPTIMDSGELQLAEIGSYYTVLNGPLLDELKVDTIHIMSPTTLTPSGSDGLFNCTKAK